MISIIIPAYNESKTLYENVNEILNYLREMDAEVILIDDGSKDNTWEVITKLAKENQMVRGIKFSRNFGKEAALLAGLTEAKGDAMIPMDADLQDPPRYIKDLVAKWNEGYKVVECTSTRTYKESFFHRLCATSFYRVLKKLTKIDMMNARDYRLMDRQVVDEIIALGDRNLFFKGMANFVGFKKTTITVETDARQGDTSKFSFKSLMKLALNAITSFSVDPLIVPMRLGIFSLILTAVLFVSSFFINNGAYSMRAAFLFHALEFLMVSMILISLGIIGFYLGKMYEQVKGRPRYIIEERV